jgi:hypothetical protein
MPSVKVALPPKKGPRNPLPEELTRDAIAHEDTDGEGPRRPPREATL